MSDIIKLPPALPQPAPEPPPGETAYEPIPSSKPFYRLHPVSGGLVILIDNAFFGAEALTVGLAEPIICLIAFTITFAGVYFAQRRLDRDRRLPSFVKAFISGVLAGVPTSISGTVFGTLVLFASGLSAFKSKLIK